MSRNRRCHRAPAVPAHPIPLLRRTLALLLLPVLLLSTSGILRPGAALAAPVGARLRTVQTPQVDWTPVYYKGRSYVPLNQVAAYYNFRSPEVWSKTFTLRSKDFSVEITQGEKQIRLNGWTFFCSFPVLKQENIPLMSVFDVRNVLDPILRPTDRRDPAILRTVIIDPSGGGKDKGIEASGVIEKELTLDMARILGVLLKNNGYKVILTRSEDKVVLPAARVKIANGVLEEAVYLNLRAASSPSALKGFECSTLPPAGTPATNESDSPNIDKRFFPGNISDRESLALATVVQNSAVSKTGTTDLGVRRVRVEELRDLGMPAISCKLGYLSSKTEAAKLATKEYRQQLALAMVEGIGRYADFLRRNMAERTEEDRVRPLKFGPVTVKQEVGLAQTTTVTTNPDREQARQAAAQPPVENAPAGPPAAETPAPEAEASPAPDVAIPPLSNGEPSSPPAPAGSGEPSSPPAPANSGESSVQAQSEAKTGSYGWFGNILKRFELLPSQAKTQPKPEQATPASETPLPVADPNAPAIPAPPENRPASGTRNAAPQTSPPASSEKSLEVPPPSTAPPAAADAAASAEAPPPADNAVEEKSKSVPATTQPVAPAAESEKPQPPPEEKTDPPAQTQDPEKAKPSTKKTSSGDKTKASPKSTSATKSKANSKSAARNRSPEDDTGDDWGKKTPAKKSSKSKPSADKPADKPAPAKPAQPPAIPDSAGDRITLRLPIVASGTAAIDRSQVELQIFLFESVNNGEIDLTTSNPPETRWLSVLPDWKAGVPEWFQAVYLRPPFTAPEEKQYGKRAYYGYVARLIYAGRVMDETCYPPNLNRCLYYFTPVFPRR